MNEQQALEAMSDYAELKAVEGGPLILAKAKGYLEAVENSHVLSSALKTIAALECPGHAYHDEIYCFKRRAEDALAKWQDIK